MVTSFVGMLGDSIVAFTFETLFVLCYFRYTVPYVQLTIGRVAACCWLWYHLVWHWPATDLISTLNKDQHSHQCHTAAQMVTKLPVYVLCALLAINLVLMIRAADFKQWQKLHF